MIDINKLCYYQLIPISLKEKKCLSSVNIVIKILKQRVKKIIFCSTSCSNRARGKHLQKTKDKISNKLKTYYETNESPFKVYNSQRDITFREFVCPSCNIEVKIEKWRVDQTCGNKKCISLNRSKVTGGYREGSGRSKSGYYNGIYSGSTYELLWMLYNDYHNISYKRFEGFIEYGNGKRYFPDFIQDNIIIEIKGFHTDVVDIKAKIS